MPCRPMEKIYCVPTVYCLTPNRTTRTYTRILEKLKALRPGLAPTSIMTDFEQASLKAFAECFPQTDRRGCFFHFRQANYRKIQGRSMFKLYADFYFFLNHFLELL